MAEEETLTLKELKSRRDAQIIKEQIDQEITALKQQSSDLNIKVDDDKLYAKLQEKWGLADKDKIVTVEENMRLKELMLARKNKKTSKLMQIQEQYDEMQAEEFINQNELSKHEQMPKAIQQQLKDFPNQRGVVNVGQQWSDIIEQSTQRRLAGQHQAYTNFYWQQIKRGRLGVDLFAIMFGIFGIMLVPMYFWNRQYGRKRDLREEIRLVSSVQNWETSELDIDDVSVQGNNYNLFTEEFNMIIKKKLEIQQEINRLLGREK